jgi:chromosome segregation ATPase
MMDQQQRQQHAESYSQPTSEVARLRAALQEANQRDNTAKSVLAKSDAVILELRSSIRQLKRSVEQLQRDKEQAGEQIQALQLELSSTEDNAAYSLHHEQEQHRSQVNQLQAKLQVSESQAKEQMVGELQVQLDRAHAQILTADMVRKELEDTLEAEQYTWELRVQDQERQIVQLQEDCKKLEDDLEQCRNQWREAEEGWSEEVKALRGKTNTRDVDVSARLTMLEKEREELQACLDEAMNELEAVDQELRQNPNVLEPLQHLYRWLLERNGKADQRIPSDANQLVQCIEELIEDSPNESLKVAELEAQLSVYRGDLKAREESSAELRASLKEAVALLKPLQDAVAKTDQEKQDIEEELERVRKHRDELLVKSQGLSPSSASRSMPSGEEQYERDTRSKRDQKQEELKKLLNTAQSKFQSMHKDKVSVMDENAALRNRIEELERELIDQKSIGDEESIKRNVAAEMRDAAIQQLEEDMKKYESELQHKERELVRLQDELRQAPKPQVGDLEREAHTKRQLEQELTRVNQELMLKTEAERMLNDSLKEALSLLKPLQMHLETAEREKKSMSKQLKSARKKVAMLENNATAKSRSLDIPDDQVSDLEVVIKELENENAQLRPQQSKLQLERVELQARYDVTQKKLDATTVENRALVDALQHHEQKEREMMEELRKLRKQLQKSNHELENAKFIATSALVKVEELTMADLSSTISRDIVANKNGFGNSHPSEVQRLKLKLESLQQEVESARQLNESLEESIQERDEMLQALAEQHQNSPNTPRGSGGHRVSWEK